MRRWTAWGPRRTAAAIGGGFLAGLAAGLLIAGRPWLALGCGVAAVGLMGAILLMRRRPAEGSPGPVLVPVPAPPATDDESVTVVVCARDEARFIATCIRSVLAQSHRNLECIVIDDGSTDRTLDEILACAKDDRLVVYSNDQPKGLAAARNRGLAAAAGSWITFLDGDDFLLPDAIARRLRGALDHRTADGWSAGAYCDWLPIPETGGRVDAAPQPRSLSAVAFLKALDDVPFIASAPLLATDVVRALGGFDEDAATAEDALLWARLLRNGFTLGYAPYVGIAYRQRRESMFRVTALRHAEVIAGMVESSYRAMDEPPVPGAPFPYMAPAGEYLAAVTRFRRLTVAYAIALAGGNESVEAAARDALVARSGAYLRTALDLEEVARAAAWRVGTAGGEHAEIAETIARTVTTELETLVPRTERPEMPSHPAAPSGRSVRTPQLIEAPAAGRVDVVIMPSAAYHAAEAGPLADRLRSRGWQPLIAVPEVFADRVTPSLARFCDEVAPLATNAVLAARAIVVFDDWGTETQPIVEAAAAAGLITFAKVEGVQDFEDADVGRVRRPYRTASIILGQGANDAAALPDADVRIVGSSRLERVWRAPPREAGEPLAVVNVNFTWGVLDEARERWVETAAEACRRAGLPFTISLHPVEGDHWDGRYPIADAPMRHLLTKASVLISRFSTVPFEAMARGVPFIYHNPHGEKVPTFQEPDGAFDISDDVPSLVDALGESRRWVTSYRDRAAAFFLRQIDVDPEIPSEERAAAVIADALG